MATDRKAKAKTKEPQKVYARTRDVKFMLAFNLAENAVYRDLAARAGEPLAVWIRRHLRQAAVAETGNKDLFQ